jgi:Spy/CpxP family protein refolding chaperone
MRTKYFKVAILAIVISSLLIGISLAQPPGKRGGPQQEGGERFLNRIPDITEEQKEQIKEIKTDHMKEVLPIRNQIDEKQAQLKTLSTADKVDMPKVNKTIEEIGELKVNIAKKRAAHRQGIRNALTEDQRVVFDSMPMKKGHQKEFAGRQGHKRCDNRPGRKF